MKRSTIIGMIGILIWADHVHADMAPPEFARSAVSRNGLHLMRVAPAKWQGGVRKSKAQATVFSYDADQDAYTRSGSFSLGNQRAAEFLFISDDGQRLIFVNIGHWLGDEQLGIRIFSREGRLLRKWRLAEFLTPDMVKGTARTGSTTQWFESGAIHDQSFSFQGPAQTLKGGLQAPFTVMRGAKKKLWYSFTIDLKRMRFVEGIDREGSRPEPNVVR